MIGLVEYIKDKNLGLRIGVETELFTYKGSFNEYLKWKRMNDNEINEHVFEDYYYTFIHLTNKHTHESLTYGFHWINEMLKPHDPTQLIKALNKQYAKKYKCPIKLLNSIESKNSLKRITLLVPTLLVINDDNFLGKFADICDTYMYCIRGVDKDNFNEKWTPVDIEPILGDNCTDFIKNDCNGIIYHITLKDNEDSIERKGINPHAPNDLDRFEYNRIYFACGKNWEEAKRSIHYIVYSLKNKQKNFTPENLIVLKVDVSKIKNIEFYRDPSDYSESDAVFTFITIPPKYIEGKIIYSKISK